MDDTQYPCWLVLVPRVNCVREVIELSEAQQQQMWREVAATSRVVQVGAGAGGESGLPAFIPAHACP